MKCPDCDSGRREDGFNRDGWFWLACHRRYNPTFDVYSPENEYCRITQLEERVRELEDAIEETLAHRGPDWASILRYALRGEK